MKKLTINKIEKNNSIKSLGSNFSLQLDIDESTLFVQMSLHQSYFLFVFPVLRRLGSLDYVFFILLILICSSIHCSNSVIKWNIR